MFIRIFVPDEQKEILFNTNTISKIEVKYQDEAGWEMSLEQAAANPNARRMYIVFFAGREGVAFGADPNDPVVKVIEDIYRNAIKASPPKEETDNDE